MKPATPYGRRIERVIDSCGYASKAAFASALQIDAQKLHNWVTRDKIGTGAREIKALTGVSLDWLVEGGEGDPVFPDGPRMAQVTGVSPALALTIKSLADDVKALRYVVAALVETFIETTPAAAEGMAQLLADVEERSQFVVQIQESVAEAPESLAAPPRGSRASGHRGSKRRAPAS